MADTIAAIATGGQVSAIGIVRVSGCDAITAADKLFKPSGGVRLLDSPDRLMRYGELRSPGGDLIDLCMCMVSRAPNTYSGEDIAEFHCHGSPVVLTEALRALFELGVRQAQAGEFTKRAFLGGRMDLTQAEAVIDLIESETPAAARNAAGQLCGALTARLEPVYSALLDIMAHFHAVIDYPDEDIDEFDMREYTRVLRYTREALARLLSTHARGRVLREGIPTAIIGRPNTGKSSLLNALLGYDRAIVTDIPGTTRDTIEEKINAGGILLRLTDTAGLRKTGDSVEKLGIERSVAAINAAGLVILVLDGTQELSAEDLDARRLIPENIPAIAAVNKADLRHVLSDTELEGLGLVYCRVSALTGEGVDELVSVIHKKFPEHISPSSGELITNVRHAEALSRALDGIAGALAAIEDSITPDAVLTEIEAALAAIGELTGKSIREDITLRIFERFCVGK